MKNLVEAVGKFAGCVGTREVRKGNPSIAKGTITIWKGEFSLAKECTLPTSAQVKSSTYLVKNYTTSEVKKSTSRRANSLVTYARQSETDDWINLPTGYSDELSAHRSGPNGC